LVELTKLLDELFTEPARRTGIPREQLSAQIGGEVIGNVLEFISGLFAKGWLKPAINGSAAIIALGYSMFAKDVPERLRRELIPIGTHLAMSAIKDMANPEVVSSLQSFRAQLKAGNVHGALSAVLATPEEIKSALRMGGGTKTAGGTTTVTAFVPAPTPLPPPAPSPQQAPETAQEYTERSEVY
jgi:hypothetical protein